MPSRRRFVDILAGLGIPIEERRDSVAEHNGLPHSSGSGSPEKPDQYKGWSIRDILRAHKPDHPLDPAPPVHEPGTTDRDRRFGRGRRH